MPTTTTQAPPLPPRHPAETQTQPPDHDEPPPAYTPSPAQDTSVLQVGPRYPFGSTEPTTWTDPYQIHAQLNPTPPGTQNYSTPPLPQFTSSQSSQSLPTYHQPPPQQQHQPQSSWNAPPNPQYPQNSFPIPASSEPTSVPTPGRPLLFEDRILVYPYVNGVCYFCPKCCNTGFKGFDATRPCRKCWLKYGKPWQVVRISPMTHASMANLQRPLPPTGFISYQPPPLVVRPGDPRIGGRLCLNCNGSGSKQEEINFFNVFLGGGGSEVCPSCRGTGRIF